MQVTYATVPDPTSGRPNEDFVLASENWVVLLDGATAPQSVASGCIHDVAWYVRHLAAGLAIALTEPNRPLTECLHDGIEWTNGQHRSTCDLENQASPSSTVAIVRRWHDELDYLALADSPLLIGRKVVVDDRTAHLSDYSTAGVRAARNAKGGFWVAQTNPDAAAEALTGTVNVAEAGEQLVMLTDGASRWVERFSRGSWADMRRLVVEDGPAALIDEVRAIEYSTTIDTDPATGRWFKPHDDATAVLVTL